MSDVPRRIVPLSQPTLTSPPSTSVISESSLPRHRTSVAGSNTLLHHTRVTFIFVYYLRHILRLLFSFQS